MFNLEKSITEWRRQMLAAGISSNNVLDELESHLREDVERRLRCGTPAQQAFEEAVQQVGRPKDLKLEFGKIERLRPSVSPRLINIGCAALGAFTVFTGTWLLLDVPIAERLLGLFWLTLVGAYVVALPHLNRRVWPGVRGLALRKTFAIVCSLFVTAWVAVLLLARTNIIHLSLGTEILPNLIFWPMIAATTATILILVCETDTNVTGFWSPAAQQCLAVAHQEAREFHHDFIGTEHILLGLLESEDTPVAKVLGQMGVHRQTVRAEIEKIVAPLPQSLSDRAPAYTPRAKKSMKLALEEAGSQHRNRVEEPDLLLGLLREGSGVAALVLKKLGVDLNQVRREILKKAN